MFALIRLAILLLTRRWGLILVGTALAVAGLIVGATSHQVAYQTVNKGMMIHYLYGQNSSGGDDSSDAYIELQDGSLYFLKESDFTPSLTSDTIQSPMASIVYDTTNTKSINITADTGTHLSGTGDQVVQLTSFDNDGQNAKTFTTSEYQQNPNGFYQNNWVGGMALLLLGLLLGGAALLLPMFMPGLAMKAKRGGPGFSMSPPANSYQQPLNGQPGAYPPAYPPYQQPYPGANQYPQQGGYPPYPAQYGQPSQQGFENPAPQAPAYPPAYPAAPQAPTYPPAPGSYEPTRYAPPPGTTQYGSPYDYPPNAQ